MLQKLKLKLVLLNFFTFFFILLVIFFFSFFFLRSRFLTEEKKILQNVAVNENLNKIYIPNEEDPESESAVLDGSTIYIGTFFIKIGTDGKIIKESENIFSKLDYSEYLIKKVNSSSEEASGEINFGELSFSYYISKKSDGYIYVFTDISDRKNTLFNISIIFIISGAFSLIFIIIGSYFFAGRAIQPVREAIKRQDKFIADASHELRTPLSVIRTNIELVIDSPEETVQKNMKWLIFIHNEVIRMTKMTEDLLSLMKSGSKEKKDFKKEILNLKDLATELFESFLPLIKENGLTGEFICKERIFLNANYSQIRQLITIFIDNAIKYTKTGSVLLEINKIENNACIKIADTGIGMSREEQEKIFERFYRVDKSRSKKGGGFGLGLNIAKNIIDEYKGKIIIISEPEKGTEFEIFLPLNT